MPDNVNALKDYTLTCLDGDMGRVREFFFDDQYWAIRYLVADTGHWIPGRQVLISPYALGAVDREKRSIVVNLTRKQIEDSPSLDSDKPVSRQFEQAYFGFFGWPTYWSGEYMWGAAPTVLRERDTWIDPGPSDKSWDPHLRSTNDVTGHHIQATDAEIGHVEDFIIEDDTWAIRYLVVDTRNWWPGKRIVMSPQWIERVSWLEKKVFVALSSERIKESPEYTADMPVTREYETALHMHYDRNGYWVDAPATVKHSR